MRTITLHRTDIILDKESLTTILKSRKLNYKELYSLIENKFGVDIGYKAFMHLCTNRASWLYAYAIVNVLEISIDDIFHVVEVDVAKKLAERLAWQEQYEHRKKIDVRLI